MQQMYRDSNSQCWVRDAGGSASTKGNAKPYEKFAVLLCRFGQAFATSLLLTSLLLLIGLVLVLTILRERRVRRNYSAPDTLGQLSDRERYFLYNDGG